MAPNRPISSVNLPPRMISKKKLPSGTTEPFSTIINEAHAAEITSWIDKKKADAYSATNYPYGFKLRLRGNRDNFTPASFWKLCYKQTNVVVVTKINDTDRILGDIILPDGINCKILE
ncbi:hypothetical protein C2G38_2049537 [Gigaspora rosea]|uniref:Uncharacterized protein n=1 Tax=Gigaspora rosea TaxID=44941 RepID=A0A397TYT0_9GLOM|nr:hypothetical protein C2G38_2049537 [Gigaspora rosea]